MRLNSRKGTDGLPVFSLNCDGHYTLESECLL